MTVQPLREWALKLFVFKEPVPFISAMLRHPAKYSYLKFHSGAGQDSACLADEAHRRERRSQLRQGVRPFVKREYVLDWSINEHALHEYGHASV